MEISIDEIMNMLDWQQPEVIQEQGRKLAMKTKCFHIFLRPTYPQYNKNVWDNCAKIIEARTDEELRPYLSELFQWLEDMNWPGAFCIWDRLKKYGDKERLYFVLNRCISIAKVLKRKNWLENLREFQGMDDLSKSKNSELIESFARKIYDDLIIQNLNIRRQIYDKSIIFEGMSEYRKREIQMYQSFDDEQKKLFIEIMKEAKINTIRELFSVLEGYGSPCTRVDFQIELKINGMDTDGDLTNIYNGVVMEEQSDLKQKSMEK